MVKLMTVLTDEDHPNADRLRVYTLRSTLKEPVLQVVANLTNVYSAGDTVAVAQVGYVVSPPDSDSFRIVERKVRGVLSQGMMLGKHDGESGTDVTEAFEDFDFS